VSESTVWQARDLILSRAGGITDFEGQSISGEESMASGYSYTLLTNFGWKMRLAYLRWETGEREMRALDCNSTEHRMHDMCNRLRMSISPVEVNLNHAWMELSQARLIADSDPIRTTKKKATPIELLEGAGGISAERELEKLGARFGTREQLLGDTGRRRGYICTVFPDGDVTVPPTAFALVRVLPVWHQYGV